MLFEYDITIPHGTDIRSAVEEKLRIERGVIRRISIFYTPQSFHLVKVKIFYGDSPLFPFNPNGWSKGSGYEDSTEYFYPILDEPYELKLVGYNEDEVYDHTITVRINVLPVWSLYPFSDEIYRLMQKEETRKI